METGSAAPVLSRTPLYDWHVKSGAKIVDFAGWSMPVYYSSIVDEHLATRRSVGLFDISHMGRLRFDGPDAETFLDRLLTRRVRGMLPGKIRYSLVTNEAGGILDDVLIYRLVEKSERPYWLLVVNASNRAKIVAWIHSHTQGMSLGFRDLSADTAMIAVQGPKALHSVAKLVSCDVAAFEYYSGREATIAGHDGIVSRTGYTGEDGCEVIVPATSATAVWNQIMDAAKPVGGVPVGLGARDTLRLEAAMPLYGHELSEQINPFQAGLSFAVNLKDRKFIGSEALSRLKDDTTLPCRVGLEMEGKRIPREHFPVLAGSGTAERIGEVTSGTFAPLLERPIAMAYVPPKYATVGTPLAIDIRGRAENARVVPLPFYSRPVG